jgi:hypothetical protein
MANTTALTNLSDVELPDVGFRDAQWGDDLRIAFGLGGSHGGIDDAIAGVLSKSVAGSSNVTLTGAEALHHTLIFTGTLTGNINVIVPTKQRNYRVFNNTSGSFTLTVKTAAGSGILVPQGTYAMLNCDGTNVTISMLAATNTEADARSSSGRYLTPANAAAMGYMLSGFQTYTASGTSTWTKPTNVRAVLVEVQAGGGGGGGVSNGSGFNAGGGGAGGFARKWVSSPGSTETVIVGAGGTAGANTGGNGGNGGSSSFGTHCSATGGTGGGGATSVGNFAGGAGGSGSSGDINVTGNPGGNALGVAGSTNQPGLGGSGMFGGGGQSTPANGQGGDGSRGGGGAGASRNAAAATGGVGGAGLVAVWEFK